VGRADPILEKYQHPVWKKYAQEIKTFGHGGSDFFCHHIGQPGLVYRAKVIADMGKHFTPQLHGMAIYSSNRDEILQPVKGITTAKDIFEDITIRVIRTEAK
jgi:hypothetical protein